jgi:hypothetical protein
MHNRLRLLQATTALLYLGPLLAGLSGQTGALIPVFVLVFLMWSVILRPHLWPRHPRELARTGALLPLVTLTATQVLLVLICFVIGRGIGGALGVQPDLPGYLPLALSFLSVPLSRLIWNPLVAEQNAGFDPLLHKLDPVPVAEDTAMADAMLAQVMALPDDVAEEVLQQHLTAIAAHLDPVAIRRGLGDALVSGRASRAAIKALILHATDPAVGDLMSGSTYPAQGFAAAGRDSELLALFARRCLMALQDQPDLAPDCPALADVQRAAQEVGEDGAAVALNRLAGLLEQGRQADSMAR